MRSQECDNAVERLEVALVEKDQHDERFHAAVGTSTELPAYVGLQAAVQEVRAREAWIDWVEDERY